MSHRDSPRLGTIWTCLRTAPLSALLDGSMLWTQTQDKVPTSGGYYPIAHSFSHSLRAHFTIFFFPIFARALFLYLRYSIDPQSDPEALFRIASDTGSISTVMELDREQEQWHNITVIATQRGMSTPLPSGAMSSRAYQSSYFPESTAGSWEYKVYKWQKFSDNFNVSVSSLFFQTIQILCQGLWLP